MIFNHFRLPPATQMLGLTWFSTIWPSSCHLDVELAISNSLIIHEENTKGNQHRDGFGYVMKHLHKIKPTFISIFKYWFVWDARSNTRKSVLSGYPNTSKFLKKLVLRPRFSTHFSGFGYPDETLFLVFNLLHPRAGISGELMHS